MLRFAMPLFLVLAAAFVTWQNLDGDEEFFLLPFVEVLPGVGDDLVARGEATSVILFVFAGTSLLLQSLSYLRARRREGELQGAADSLDAVRDWRDEAAWDDRLTASEGQEAASEADETHDLDG